jgi:hypothetical protein
MPLTLRASSPAFFALLLACQNDTAAVISVSLQITVQADPGFGLPGVPVRIDGELLGRTDASGALRRSVHGAPGRLVTIVPECPRGHRQPEEPSRIRLRRYGSSGELPIEVDLQCRPLVRVAIFVVRAANGANIPIVVNGEHVATTNSAGVAHFSRWGAPGTEYLVQLDASGNRSLLPQSASALVELPDFDELFIVERTFQSAQSKGRRHFQRRRIIKIE